MCYKSRPRKALDRSVPLRPAELRELLLPPSSHLPLHFEYPSSPPKRLRPACAGRPGSLADSGPGSAPTRKIKTVVRWSEPFQVLRLGDDYFGSKVVIKTLGLDVGTKTVVLSYEGPDGRAAFLSEINGYYLFDRGGPFIKNMLNDPNRVRADGSRRPARWFQQEGDERIFVLGRDAEEFAYAKNETLLRPMAEGGITPDEDSMMVLSAIIHGLLATAEQEAGKFDPPVKLTYCTTATALNAQNNIAYHERVVDLIVGGYSDPGQIEVQKLKESHAIVINESPDGTGIGVSWGAGTVTVSYVKYGLEIYSFCWVGAGDWIDDQVARRYGYNPDAPKALHKRAKETPTTICKRKHELDLTIGAEPTDRVGLDLLLHYQVLIAQVIDGIVQGFVEHESSARIDEAIPVYMAGGTASPVGFEERVAAEFQKRDLPFEIASVQKAARPLYCVSEGLLKAAQLF